MLTGDLSEVDGGGIKVVDGSPLDRFMMAKKRLDRSYLGAAFGYVAYRSGKQFRNLGCRIVLGAREPHQQWRFHAERDGVVVSRGWISLAAADAVVSSFSTGAISLGGQRLLLCDPRRLDAFEVSASENSTLTRRLVGWPAWELVGVWGETAPQLVGAPEFERLSKNLPVDKAHYFAGWERLSQFLCEGGGPFEISYTSHVVAGIYAPLRARLEGPVRRRKSRIAVTVCSEVDPRVMGLAVVLAPRGTVALTITAENWRPKGRARWNVEGPLPGGAPDVDAGLLFDGLTVDQLKHEALPSMVGPQQPGLGVREVSEPRPRIFTTRWWHEHLAEAAILLVVGVIAGVVSARLSSPPVQRHAPDRLVGMNQPHPSSAPTDTVSHEQAGRTLAAARADRLRRHRLIAKLGALIVEGDSLKDKCINGPYRPIDETARWKSRVRVVLRKSLGDGYVIRFDHAPIGQEPGYEGVKISLLALWADVDGKQAVLAEFIQELQLARSTNEPPL